MNRESRDSIGDGVIIEAALNGAVPTSVNATVPRTPDEIVKQALECVAAGAAMVHNHNDEPAVGGPPSHGAASYAKVWNRILAIEPNVILYPTMRGWGPETTIARRYEHVIELAQSGLLGCTIIDLGPTSTPRSGPNGLPAPTDDVYVTTMADLDYMFRVCHEIGLPICLGVFEPGHLRTGLAYVEAGLAPRGTMAKLFFDPAPPGVAARGCQATAAGLQVYLELLSGFEIPWMANVCESEASPEFMRMVIDNGGHLSVGIERTRDSRGRSNVELVRDAVELSVARGRLPMSCEDARKALSMPVRSL